MNTLAPPQARKAAKPAPTSLVAEVLRTPGVPLDTATRADMEPRFGHDFGKVPIHNQASAANLEANQIAIRELHPTGLQKKLSVNEPGDRFEQEADRIADQVARSGPNQRTQASPPEYPAPLRHDGPLDGMSPTVRDVLSSGGRALPPDLREEMSGRFGRDFSTVRVHDSSIAEKSAQAVNAEAYTVGPNVVFGGGRFAPSTQAGRRLIAHELTHVVQQSGGGGSPPMIQRSPADSSRSSSNAAPTPTLAAENPLVDAMTEFASIRPSSVASGIYTGSIRGKSVSLSPDQYAKLKIQVKDVAGSAIRRASSRAETAIGRHEEQQLVDKHHWIIAPIIKTLGNVSDPGPVLVEYVNTVRLSVTEARHALDAGDFISAARLIGDAEGNAELASRMVLAYVDQIIGTTEMTVTVLEGVKTASEVIVFLCAVAATGGTAGAGATALGLEGVGATTTLGGITASTATWATAVGTTAAITTEVGLGIVRAADGDPVDWTEIATHAAIQAVIARFSGPFGQRVNKWVGSAAAYNPVIREAIARVGMARVVTIATNLLMHEGSQIFATAVEGLVKVARPSQKITWSQFGEQLWDRISDPKGLLMATLAGALGGTHPEPERENPPIAGGKVKPPTASKTDNNDWRDINKELELPKPRTKQAKAPTPPPGHKQTTAEEAFRSTPAEVSAAVQAEVAANGPPRASNGEPINESANASPKGSQFQAASMKKPSGFAKTIRADGGEVQAYKEALSANEIGLESPQGVNVSGRADFITAAKDASGEMWIIANDAKTYAPSPKGFPAPEPGLRPGWDAQVKAAVERANVGDPALKAEITAAYKAGRIWVRQVNVKTSMDPNTGTLKSSGIAPPSPVPWGALLGPRDLKKTKKDGPE